MAAKIQFNPRSLVHMPGVVSHMGRKYLENRKKLAESGGFVGVPLGIPSVDKVMLPLLPGQLCTVLARPGNGKTAFLIRWARWWASVMQENVAKYKENSQFFNQYVCLVSTEQTVEELNAFMAAAGTQIDIANMARGKFTEAEWARVESWSNRRSSLPLVIIGMSEERRRARVPLRMDVVADAMQSIEEDFGLKAGFICMDWLQQMKPPLEISYRDDSKTIAISENLALCKQMALNNGCPMVVSAQAARKVDQYDIQIPNADDGQWTSSLEQDSDTQLSLVRPRKYRQEGEMFGDYKVEGDTQLVINLIKQKMGEANIIRVVRLDPRYNKLDDMETMAMSQDTWEMEAVV